MPNNQISVSNIPNDEPNFGFPKFPINQCLDAGSPKIMPSQKPVYHSPTESTKDEREESFPTPFCLPIWMHKSKSITARIKQSRSIESCIIVTQLYTNSERRLVSNFCCSNPDWMLSLQAEHLSQALGEVSHPPRA